MATSTEDLLTVSYPEELLDISPKDLQTIASRPNPELTSYAKSYTTPSVVDAKGDVPWIVKSAGWTFLIAFIGFCFILLGGMHMGFHHTYYNIPDTWKYEVSGAVFTTLGLLMVIGAGALFVTARNIYLKILEDRGFGMSKKVFKYQEDSEETPNSPLSFPNYGATELSLRNLNREISQYSAGSEIA